MMEQSNAQLKAACVPVLSASRAVLDINARVCHRGWRMGRVLVLRIVWFGLEVRLWWMFRFGLIWFGLLYFFLIFILGGGRVSASTQLSSDEIGWDS